MTENVAYLAGKKVVILQHRIPHYRIPLFEIMRRSCEEVGLELIVYYGRAADSEKLRQDESSLAWGKRIDNVYRRIFGVDLLWQKIPSNVDEADLVIMVQENRILSNYKLIAKRKLARRKVAFWGHGANFQASNRRSLSEKWKVVVLSLVDWWFAYTDATVDVLVKSGFDKSRITCLNNSIDTRSNRKIFANISSREVALLNKQYGIPDAAKVGLYCGSLDRNKGIDVLLQSAKLVKKEIPDFYLIIIGAGAMEGMVNGAARECDWIKVVGTKVGREKLIFFKRSMVMLNPGMLGLHILESFSVGLPLVSIVSSSHSPEVVYVRNYMNAILTSNTIADYSSAVVRMLSDDRYRKHISNGAEMAGQDYSVEDMAHRFMTGIVDCLRG